MSEKFLSREKKEKQQLNKIEEKIKNLGLDKERITEGELKQKMKQFKEYLQNLTEEDYDTGATTRPVLNLSFEVGKADNGGWEDKGEVGFSIQTDGRNFNLFPNGGNKDKFEYESELIQGESNS
jgi:hypothetical protein